MKGESGRPSRVCASFLALLVTTGNVVLACSSSSSDTPAPGSSCPNAGGPVPGDADMHCTDADGKPIVQETTTAACMDTGAGDAGGGQGGAPAEGTPSPLFNSEGDDDDCKYHVKFSVSCVEKNQDVTLTVHANLRTDYLALIGANPHAEIYLNDTHLAPNTHPKTTVVADGVDTIGPVRFDESGRWTVRFHFFETCLDVRGDSPHGHVAFYVDVP